MSKDFDILNEDNFQQLVAGIKNGEAWAVKMYFRYVYGEPKQMQRIEKAL